MVACIVHAKAAIGIRSIVINYVVKCSRCIDPLFEYEQNVDYIAMATGINTIAYTINRKSDRNV